MAASNAPQQEEDATCRDAYSNHHLISYVIPDHVQASLSLSLHGKELGRTIAYDTTILNPEFFGHIRT